MSKLLDYGFEEREPMFVGWNKRYIKGYGLHKAQGEIVVYEDGRFSFRAYCEVFDEVYADIVRLRKEGLIK